MLLHNSIFCSKYLNQTLSELSANILEQVYYCCTCRMLPFHIINVCVFIIFGKKLLRYLLLNLLFDVRQLSSIS